VAYEAAAVYPILLCRHIINLRNLLPRPAHPNLSRIHPRAGYRSCFQTFMVLFVSLEIIQWRIKGFLLGVLYH